MIWSVCVGVWIARRAYRLLFSGLPLNEANVNCSRSASLLLHLSKQTIYRQSLSPLPPLPPLRPHALIPQAIRKRTIRRSNHCFWRPRAKTIPISPHLPLARPISLLLMQYIQRLAHNMVFCPVDGGTAHDILRAGDICEFGRLLVLFRIIHIFVLRFFPSLNVGISANDEGAAGCGFDPAVLDGLSECLRIIDCILLHLLERFQILETLLSLDLQDRERGAEGYGVGVITLRDWEGWRWGMLDGIWR